MAVRLASLDAVTLDANGTLLKLRDPVPALARLLADRGAARPPERVRAAFAAEAVYYREHCAEGRDGDAVGRLRRACARVFLAAAGAPELDSDSFAEAYVTALEFELLPDTVSALTRLRAHGLALAVVSNWDASLHDRARELGLTAYVDAVVPCADAGHPKPHPAPLELALARLGVPADRALHVGDSDDDRRAAAAARVPFLPAPVERVLDAA